jgi:L-cysteine S-thiosulfotransferase
MRNAIRAAVMLAVPLLGGSALAQTAGAPLPLVTFEVKEQAILASLTGAKGDPKKGEAVVVNRQQGNCLACHVVSALKREPFHGNTGPTLDGVAGRLSEGEIRLRMVDGTKVNPDTMMPSFYRIDGLNRVLPQFRGKPILTAEQVEDVVAYLMTLKD